MKKLMGIYILIFIIIFLGVSYFIKTNTKKLESSISFYPTCSIKEEDTPYISSGIKKWSDGPRNITINCQDKDNNCMKEEYTQTFTKDSLIDYITISDTDGNKKKCYVTTYIDTKDPIITVKVFRVGEDNDKIGSPLATISSDKKNLLTTEDINKNVNGYLNNKNFPYGIYLEVNIKDNLSLNNYSYEELETNNYLVKDKKKYEYNQSSKKELVKEDTMSYLISKEGTDKSRITLSDGANHITTFNIEVKLDRTAPSIPIVKMYKWKDNSTKPKKKDIDSLEEYISNEWTSKNIYTIPYNSTDDVSENIIYKYSSSGSTTKLMDFEAKSKNVKAQGTSKISYTACDEADNCSSNSPIQIIKIDRSGPYFDMDIKSTKKTYNTPNINYSFSGHDALSGVDKYCIGIDNECIPNIDIQDNKKVEMKDYNINNSSDGSTKKIYICLSDKVNNIICHNNEYNIYKECSETKIEESCSAYTECDCNSNKKYADKIITTKDKYLNITCEETKKTNTCIKKCKCD